MGTFRQLGKFAAVFGVALLMATACTPDTSSSDDEEAVEAAVPSGTVAAPPERLSPFCEAMIGLSDQLETDPPDDVEALIIETYLDIEDEVPADIAPDFAAVLADLQDPPASAVGDDPESTSEVPVSSVAATVDDDDESDEGYLPSEDPTARLSAYVDYTCGGSLNNPGPPATQPLEDITPTTAEP